MSSRWLLPFLILNLSLILSCKQAPPPEKAVSSMTHAELAARFPADLGPGTVDVSEYPAELRENYKLFLAVCSSCHTPARPLNAPIWKPEDWKRFVHRMHVRFQDRGFILKPEDERRIIDFLVYDSKVRKVGRTAKFNAQTAELDQTYRLLVKERERLIEEETRRLPKKETPYVGVK